MYPWFMFGIIELLGIVFCLLIVVLRLVAQKGSRLERYLKRCSILIVVYVVYVLVAILM